MSKENIRSRNDQESSYDDMIVMMPPIEEDIPLPKNAQEALPELTVAEELEMRANTIKLLADLAGKPIEPSYKDIKDAEGLAKEMMQNPMLKPEFNKYPNETMAYLAGLVGQTNCMLVKELSEFKLYVLNNLVRVVEADSSHKEKIAALRAIGDIDGVDAFKKRSEITHTVKTTEEAENELLKMIESLKERVIDAEYVEVKEETTENGG